MVDGFKLNMELPFYTFHFPSLKEGLLDSNGSELDCFTVTDLCTIPDVNLVAVAIQRQVSKHSSFFPPSLKRSSVDSLSECF